MGDKDNGTRERCQLFLQPLDCRYIQVIGGLVQQQYFRLAHQRLGKCHASPPAPGKFSHLRVCGQA